MVEVFLVFLRSEIGAVGIERFQEATNRPTGYFVEIGFSDVVALDTRKDLAVDAEIPIRLVAGGVRPAEQASDDDVQDKNRRDGYQDCADPTVHPVTGSFRRGLRPDIESITRPLIILSWNLKSEFRDTIVGGFLNAFQPR